MQVQIKYTTDFNQFFSSALNKQGTHKTFKKEDITFWLLIIQILLQLSPWCVCLKVRPQFPFSKNWVWVWYFT